MKTETIHTQQKAKEFLIKLLIKNGELVNIKQTFGSHGHFILHNKKFRIYCLYKREYYHTFGKQYKEMTNSFGLSGIGESINESALNRAIKEGCSLIVFIHPNEIKCIKTTVMKRVCDDRGLKRIQDTFSIKFQKRGSYKPNNEFTCSIPIEMLNDFSLEVLF